MVCIRYIYHIFVLVYELLINKKSDKCLLKSQKLNVKKQGNVSNSHIENCIAFSIRGYVLEYSCKILLLLYYYTMYRK